ncbi:cytochrome ubiquinol oxidase subunit I [Bdellovibrionota bacterium]
MDLVLLSRLQFAMTIMFHYIFPQLSMGLAVVIVITEGIYLKTKNPLYLQITKFWVKVFSLIFVLGVVSGVVMEFQFGTNWSTYSRYVGDVFGSPIAAEGIFAFFLESCFLGIVVFGWNRVSKGFHFFSTVMVAVGAHLSALWIIIANSWQQTPAGHHIVETGGKLRAEIVDFWDMVFNPSTVDRFTHAVIGTWQAGAFFVLSVCAFYLLKKRDEKFAKACFKIALVFAAVASILQLHTGHSSGVGVSKTQPTKLAAFEGQYEDQVPGDLYLFGWVDEKNEKTYGVKIPGGLSFLVSGDFKKPLAGLRAFPPEDRPPVNFVFQSYHLMICIGMFLILLSFYGLFVWWRGTLFKKAWLLWIFLLSVLGPQIANQVGWISAEVGRQPWIVYGLLRTKDAVSMSVSAGEVLISLILFGLIYLLLFVFFVYLLVGKILHGPNESGEK